MSGWSGWSGWSGGGSNANPMLSEAMNRSRDALVGAWDPSSITTPMMPRINDPMCIKNWSPEVRFAVCQSELFGKLHFEVSSQTAKMTVLDKDVSLDIFKSKNLVSITRPTQTIFLAQLGLVSNYSNLREDRSTEILTQIVPQTPFFSSVVNIQPHKHKYTIEIIGLSLSFAYQSVMHFKHILACPRPIEYSPQIQPLINTPGHSSLPSGHATEAFIVARVLQILVGSSEDSAVNAQLQRQAARIAINRTVAGLHFPVDSAAGRLLGESLAGYFIHRCDPMTASYKERSFDGTKFHDGGNALDFDYHAPLQSSNPDYFNVEGPAHTLNMPSDILKTLWDLAKEEWK